MARMVVLRKQEMQRITGLRCLFATGKMLTMLLDNELIGKYMRNSEVFILQKAVKWIAIGYKCFKMHGAKNARIQIASFKALSHYVIEIY